MKAPVKSPSVTVRRVANGYVLDTSPGEANPLYSAPDKYDNVYVFETYAALTDFLAKNFAHEWGGAAANRYAVRPGASRYKSHGGLYFEGDESCAVRSRKGGEPREWPEDLRVRQFPDSLREYASSCESVGRGE